MQHVTDALGSLWKYSRFGLPFLLGWAVVYALFVSPSVSLSGLLLWLTVVLAMEWGVGEDFSTPEYRYPRIFVWLMWTYLPIVLLAFTGFAWTMSHAVHASDLFNIAAGVQALTGFDMIAAHANDGLMTYVLSTLLFSAITGIGSVSVGHELSHRTWEPMSIWVARICSAFATFSYYAIEHPYGHHLSVGTDRDSSTAFRGESVNRYFLRTMPQDYQVAWEIETGRLQKLGAPIWSLKNRLLRGWAGELAIAVFMLWISGLFGLFWFLIAALHTHFTYKLGTYAQHYGIVRVPGSEIKIHHSWTCNNRMTNWFSGNIGRHTDHHLEPEREFWHLRPFAEAPQNPYPYLSLLLMATIPSLWHRIWAPVLIEWDEHWASPEEREIARQANRRSGVPMLMAQAARQDVHMIEAEAAAGV